MLLILATLNSWLPVAELYIVRYCVLKTELASHFVVSASSSTSMLVWCLGSSVRSSWPPGRGSSASCRWEQCGQCWVVPVRLALQMPTPYIAVCVCVSVIEDEIIITAFVMECKVLDIDNYAFLYKCFVTDVLCVSYLGTSNHEEYNSLHFVSVKLILIQWQYSIGGTVFTVNILCWK